MLAEKRGVPKIEKGAVKRRPIIAATGEHRQAPLFANDRYSNPSRIFGHQDGRGWHRFLGRPPPAFADTAWLGRELGKAAPNSGDHEKRDHTAH